MAEFEVGTHSIVIEEHPNADLLEIARVGDYRSIVRKGQFQDGDICAYIPEGSVIPDSLLAEMELEGKLAGPEHNRVKAVRLRGVFSQGLVYSMPRHPAGMDVASELGIVKYEPPIPAHMSGEVENRFGHTIRFPLEDIKKYPAMFQEGEEVAVTEKIHGTWCCLGMAQGTPLVTSLGLSEKGLALRVNEANRRNLYAQQWAAHQELLDRMTAEMPDSDYYVLGEIHGGKVQDLKYGLKAPRLRVFDVMIDGQYQPQDEILRWGWETVPLLYRGPYSRDMVNELTAGPSAVETADHFREGIVIRAVPEAMSELTGGRKIAKSISEEYLLRRGGTELR